MEIKINKNFFIKFGVVIILCFTSFCFGRYIRLSGISGVHRELEQRIVLAGDTADTILDELSITRPAGQSAADTGYAILRGIQELSKSNETAQKCMNLIKNEIDNNSKIYEKYKSIDTSIIGKELDIAIEQAQRYEYLLKESQLIIYNEGN